MTSHFLSTQYNQVVCSTGDDSPLFYDPMLADSPFRKEQVERIPQHEVSPMRIDNPREEMDASGDCPNPGRLFNIRTKYSPMRSISHHEPKAPLTYVMANKKNTPRSIRSISETNIMLEYPNLMNRIPTVNIVDSPYNKENIPPSVKGDEDTKGKMTSLNSKMTGLSLGLEVPIKVSTLTPLSLSTDCIFGRKEDSWYCSTPSCDKTRLQVEAEYIRRNTRLSPRKSKLEVLTKTSQPELNCLCSEMVAKLVTGHFNELYDLIIIVDCRFEYEFTGGHIKGALNFPKEEDVERYFIRNNTYQKFGDKICIVFHCEFSSHRGPKSYKRIRSHDRKLNEPNYPELFYPEMYLLEGGYKQFYKDYPELCEPQGYVEMKDPSFIPQMRLGMQSRGRSKSQRRFFSQSCSNISLEYENNEDDDDSDGEARSLRASTDRHVIKTIKDH